MLEKAKKLTKYQFKHENNYNKRIKILQAVEFNDYSLSRGRFIRRIFIFQLAIIILNLNNLWKFPQNERHALGKRKQNRSRVTFFCS